MNNIELQQNWEDDGLHEECGVFGMYDLDGNDIASSIYYGLFALQHRGQESCGIAVSDTFGPRKVDLLKGMGLVNEVFNSENLSKLHGNIGVGHVRYSTAGESIPSNAQPLVINYVKGTLMLAHNGNLINANELRDELAYTGAIFQTTIDSEVIAYLVARERINAKTAQEAVTNAMKKLRGAYALVISSPRKLIGARDPFGFKPLCIGKRDNAYILASETCALDTIGAEFVRDVLPGEVVTIDKDGIKSDTSMCLPKAKEARCVFEYIYFARPDSNFDGVSVYQSGIPYGTAFVKNSYVGRTFIKPQQKSRESSVRIKLNVLKEAVCGKRVIMIDDSIVRGTTSDRIVQMLKDAGATEVHVRISSPPFLYECYFGTDIPSRDQLIAHNRTIEEINEIIGADSLGYLRVERLKEIAGGLGICTGCFDEKYPMEPPKEDIRGEYIK